jgi:hypothetical protein
VAGEVKQMLARLRLEEVTPTIIVCRVAAGDPAGRGDAHVTPGAGAYGGAADRDHDEIDGK